MSQTVPEFGFTWTETGSFDVLRTGLALFGSGSFDAMIGGYQVHGSASAGGSLTATSSAYSIAALAAVGGEGTGMGGALTFTVSLNDDTTALVGILALAADKLEGEDGTTSFFFELARGAGLLRRAGGRAGAGVIFCVWL